MSSLTSARLAREARELAKNPPDGVRAGPVDGNLFLWHFTIAGPPDSDFQHGIYHGRLIIPSSFPMKPPDIIFDTPSGRFQVGTRICLNITGFHQELYSPSWTLAASLVGLRSYFEDPGNGAIGAIDASSEVRRRLAAESREWSCKTCNLTMKDVFPPSPQVEEEKEDEVEKEVEDMGDGEHEVSHEEAPVPVENQETLEVTPVPRSFLFKRQWFMFLVLFLVFVYIFMRPSRVNIGRSII
ncbi:hypothetical protein RCL1_006330 [Eukaryota sp. TZLM3-RCL]